MPLILFTVGFILSALKTYAQNCNCPPIKLYVYDTKVDFNIDSYKNSGPEAGEYVEAQNSGDWLEGAYMKQPSDELKVFKGIKPGAQQGTTYETPSANGANPGNDIDFSSYAEVSRSGDSAHYSYTVLVEIADAYKGSLAASASQTTTDLGKVDDAIDACVNELSPVLNKLRDYQKKVRDESNNTQWIYLKYRVIPQKKFLTIGERTKVTIKIFDCADKKPAANQKAELELTSSNVGSLNTHNITTNGNGEALVTFTAKKNGHTQLYPDMTFTSINGKSGYHVTNCGAHPEIIVVPPKKWVVSYTITSYKYSSNKNSSETDFDESHASGNGTMVVDAPPPDASGYVIFDAPAQNKLEYGSVSGSMTENSSYISRDAIGRIDEKTIRHASGQADHQYDGVEFEYDPKYGGMLNAGISFNENHIAKFWQLDYNSNSYSLKLVDTDTSSQNDETTIGVGGSGAALKKTKTGFTIDYSAAKDTSYTDILGKKHVERSELTSHATINYIR